MAKGQIFDSLRTLYWCMQNQLKINLHSRIQNTILIAQIGSGKFWFNNSVKTQARSSSDSKFHRTIIAHHKCSAPPPHQALKFIICVLLPRMNFLFSMCIETKLYIRRALEELNSLSPSCDCQCRFIQVLNVIQFV